MRVTSEILVTSRIIQCWSGLADLEIQIASGDFEAGMTPEGVLQYEELRNCLYTRMRGFVSPSLAAELKNRFDVLLVPYWGAWKTTSSVSTASRKPFQFLDQTSMAKRTLTSCWKQFEKFSLDYLGGEKDCAAIVKKLETLTSRTNDDKIGGALETLFIRPHITQKVTVAFSVEFEDGEIPSWQTRYDAETNRVIVHPLSIFKFINDIRKIVVVEHDGDFIDLRYASFLYEIGKISSVYLLFLLVLQRVAYLLEIAHLEKRGGVIEVAEGEAYHTLLWAFKELEGFAQRTRGDSVRAMFAISWYESDWITGR